MQSWHSGDLMFNRRTLAQLMAEVGFTRAGDAWKWRGRRPPRANGPASKSHAFAELAKLKR